jgi:hypothetical protein
MFVQRTKYYVGWKLAQCGVDFCGLTYNPTTVVKETENGKKEEITVHYFNKIENCVLKEMELNENPKQKIAVKFFLILISIGIGQFTSG